MPSRVEISEREAVCINCKHFYQHYIFTAYSGFSPCNAGHCDYPRIKGRKPGDTCVNFCFKDAIERRGGR